MNIVKDDWSAESNTAILINLEYSHAKPNRAHRNHGHFGEQREVGAGKHGFAQEISDSKAIKCVN